MNSSNVIRILMALVLATGSPMWCQCMVAAVSNWDSDTSHATGHAEWTEHCDDAEPCAAVADAAVRTICCGDWCIDSANSMDGTCDCECCDRTPAAARAGSNSTTVALAFTHSAMDGLMAPSMHGSAFGPSGRAALPQTGPPKPPPLTLLAQGCLLLV